MTSYQEVFKDTFPAIVFSNEWSVVTSEEDPLLDEYGQETATRTNITGATMTFRFFGNNIDIYGSKRPTHGEYYVTIDGVDYPTLNANSPTPIFNQTLFNATLTNDNHRVVLTKVGDGTTLDIDYISMDAIIGTPTDVLDSDSFQDNDPSYEYTGDWYFPTSPGIYSSANAHITQDPNATLRHYFRVSTSVNVYGGVSPTACAAYSVSLDGGPFEVFSSRRKVTRTPQVLYFANNLGPGVHDILIQFNTTDPSTKGEFLVDFSNIYTLPSLGGSSFVLTSSLTSNSSTSQLVSRDTESQFEFPSLGSAVTGVSNVSVFLVLGLIGLVALVLRQRRRQANMI